MIRHALFLFVLASSTALAAGNLVIKHIDVEQASATLIIAPNGEMMLIDSGEKGKGKRIHAAMGGRTTLEHFLLTHYHDDHDGGLPELMKDHGVSVLHAYDRGAKESESGDHFDAYQTAVGETATTVTPGWSITFGGVRVQCVAVNGQVYGQPPVAIPSDENDCSIGLLVMYGKFRYFIGGDMHHKVEKRIPASGLAEDVDVYVASHHGSNTSSYEGFVDHLDPDVVVISNGDHGGFQHPRQVVLDMFDNYDPSPLVLQTNQLTKFSRGGGNVPLPQIADPETRDDDGTVTITVHPDLGRYDIDFENNRGHWERPIRHQ